MSSVPRPILNEQQMLTVADRLMSGLDIRDRTRFLRTYSKVFTGTEAVDWLIKQSIAVDELHAVAIGNQLLSAGIFSHVFGEHEFKNEHLFYRFTVHQAGYNGKQDGAAPQNRRLRPREKGAEEKKSGVDEQEAVRAKELAQIANKMMDEIQICDRTYLLRTYTKCFLGTDAVKYFIANNLASTEEEAIDLGRELLINGHFSHVTGEHNFKNTKLFYRFAAHRPGYHRMEPQLISRKRLKECAIALLSGVQIHDRVYHFRTYPRCFIGTEAVELLMEEGLAESESDAVKLGNALIAVGVINHVASEHLFKNEPLFYRFFCHNANAEVQEYVIEERIDSAYEAADKLSQHASLDSAALPRGLQAEGDSHTGAKSTTSNEDDGSDITESIAASSVHTSRRASRVRTRQRKHTNFDINIPMPSFCRLNPEYLKQQRSSSLPELPQVICAATARLMVVGAKGSGKHQLVERAIHDRFAPEEKRAAPSSGVSSTRLDLFLDGGLYKLTAHVNCLGGDESYTNLLPVYLKQTDVLVVCLRARPNMQQSIDETTVLIDAVADIEHECPMVIALTHVDELLNSSSGDNGAYVNTVAIAQEYAENVNAPMFMVSARTGDNVDQFFTYSLTTAACFRLHNLSRDSLKPGTAKDFREIFALARLYREAVLPKHLRPLPIQQWSGFLQKRGVFNSAFQVRFFRLEKHELKYYKGENDTKPRGAIDLTEAIIRQGGSVIKSKSDPDYGVRDEILIIESTMQQRQFRLKCKSPSERKLVHNVLLLQVLLVEMRDGLSKPQWFYSTLRRSGKLPSRKATSTPSQRERLASRTSSANSVPRRPSSRRTISSGRLG